MKLFKIFEDGSCEASCTQGIEILESILEACQQMYTSIGYREPWVAYVALHNNHIAGTCAFKSAPINNKVEIAYFTFPEFQGRGIASKMVEALIAIARAENPCMTVVAQTLPEENASNSILKKFGFHLIGTVQHADDGEVWEWHLPPENKWHLN